MKKIILVIILFFSDSFYAQVNNLSGFLEIGRASDNDAVGSFGGGGAGFQVWEPGPIIKLGSEYVLDESFSAQGFISYSFYKYDGSRSYGEKASIGYNRIIDLLGIIKWNMGIFYLNLGAGISHQYNDNIRYLEETQYHKATNFIDAKNKTVFGGQFGLGFDIHIYEKFSVLAEGDLFFREYLGSAWLLGIKYSLNKM
jgi:hypothetical protein